MLKRCLVPVLLACCDASIDHERFHSPISTQTPTPHLLTSSGSTDAAADSSGTTAALETSTTAEAPTTGSSDTSGDGSSSSGEPCSPRQVDVVLSIDVSSGMQWPLRHLADQLVMTDELLRAVNIDVRWGLVAWADAMVLVDLVACGAETDPAQAAATCVGWYADFTQAGSGEGLQPDLSGEANQEADDAALAPLMWAVQDAALPAGPGWREGATRIVVHVTDSGIVEAPTVLSGHQVIEAYVQVQAALDAAQVRVLAWAPTDASGYVGPYPAPREGAPPYPALAAEAHDIATDAAFAQTISDFTIAQIDADRGDGIDTADAPACP